jgi:hypothetical protein
VLEPPITGKAWYERGETVRAGLVLVGNAIASLPDFISAFEHLGRTGIGRRSGRAKFRVGPVHALDPLGQERATICDARRRTVADPGPFVIDFERVQSLAGATARGNEIGLRFITPTRIKFRGRYIDVPHSSGVLGAIEQRVRSLAEQYCGGRLDLGELPAPEHVRLVQYATRWVEWERWSARQGTRMKLGGFIGEARYAGEIGPFRPLLLLGSIVHVGKACAFGHGRYELVM